MRLRVVVVGIQPTAGGAQRHHGSNSSHAARHAPPGATAEVFCSRSVNGPPLEIPEQSLAAFALPLGPEHQTPKEFMAPEEFTFTLTQGNGSRLQGFCRRFLPPPPRVGARLRYPQVLVLVCEAAWSGFFFKVLEATEQLLRTSELLGDFSNRQLPPDSDAGLFLTALGCALEPPPLLGSVLRVQLPRQPVPLAMSPPKRIGSTNADGPLPLLLTEDFMELQVPPDCGNGAANAGISLARLLWHVPVPAMLTLIASLLLERRVLIVGQSRDMVSAAVCAAQALLHPFRWHHIFLPLLPRSLADYLTAPMPFLIGLPAQLLPALKNLPMDEVTLIDLDLGKCEPASGSARDDAALLPWRGQLEAALQAACSLLKSPTEMESNAVIAGIMHGYFLKLVGSYRSHVYAEGVLPAALAGGAGSRPQSASSNAPLPSGFSSIVSKVANGGGGAASSHHQRSRSDLPPPPLHASGSAPSFASAAGGGSGAAAADGALGRHSLGLGASLGSSDRQAAGGSSSMSRRQSRSSSSNITGRPPDDALKAAGLWFDHSGLAASHRRNDKARTFLLLLRQSQLFEVFIRERLEMTAGLEGGPELSGDAFERLVNTFLENRSRRLSARLGAGMRSGLSRLGAALRKHRRTDSNPQGGLDLGSTAAGLVSSIRSRGAGSAGALAERPEAVRMRAMVAAFAAAAEQMRRSLTDNGGSSSNAAAINASSSGRRHTAASVAGVGHQAADPHLGDGAADVMDPSAFFFEDDDDDDLDAAEAAAAADAAAAAGSGALGRLSRSGLSSTSLNDLSAGASGGVLVAGSAASWTAGASSSSSVGVLMMPAAAAAPALQDQAASPGALIEFSSDSSRSSAEALPTVVPAAPAAVAGSAAGLQQPQHSLQQQQQQLYAPRLQHSPRSPSCLGPRSAPAPAGFGLSSSTGAGGSGSQRVPAAASHHINVKAALASIPAGPLPQPPQPRRSQPPHVVLHGAAAPQPAAPSAPAAAAPAPAAAEPAAACWDPFAELLTERMASFAGVGDGGALPSQQQHAGATRASSGGGSSSTACEVRTISSSEGASSSFEGHGSHNSLSGGSGADIVSRRPTHTAPPLQLGSRATSAGDDLL